jgi:hypothetical protein
MFAYEFIIAQVEAFGGEIFGSVFFNLLGQSNRKIIRCTTYKTIGPADQNQQGVKAGIFLTHLAG